MMQNPIEQLNEAARWHARDVSYFAGRWDQVARLIPEFTIQDFKAEDEMPANPYLKTVIRQPLSQLERPMPVAVVSNNYTLAGHRQVALMCLEAVRKTGIETDSLRCELGLTEFGEWMNFRIYFPNEYDHTPEDGEKLNLRLECFNSVDGSSRLTILLGWYRLVCSNGLVIGETHTAIRDVHNKNMNLGHIFKIVAKAMYQVQADLEQMKQWEAHRIVRNQLEVWINSSLSEVWGKKAACRAYHICLYGVDIELADPFAPGEATEKPVRTSASVPGAVIPAANLYDVAQALSWVATQRNNPEQKLEWQLKIPRLLHKLKHMPEISMQ